jgi:uncharacterized protein
MLNFSPRTRSLIAALLSTTLVAQPALALPWINEFHYDNAGVDANEFIEIAAPVNFDFTGWQVVRYNGDIANNGVVYTGNLPQGGSELLTGRTLLNPTNGIGFLTVNYTSNGLQNGLRDGFALVGPTGFTGGINGGQVLQFLSYEGSFTAGNGATGGPAQGLVSRDIGQSENGSEPATFSLQLTGTGTSGVSTAARVGGDFTWSAPQTATPGQVNTGQTIGDAAPPPPPPPVAQVERIFTIQGERHRSAFEGRSVTTEGVVTTITSNGYYIQDATGDGNARTSDAIFVFTGSAPNVQVGQLLQLTGTVSEFLPGNNSANLTVTQLSAVSAVRVLQDNAALPEAVVLGAGGRAAPTQNVDTLNRSINSENPASLLNLGNGIDFYESLEGMRVSVPNARVTAPSINRSGNDEIFVLADLGAGSTGGNARGAAVISQGDLNPERIQIDTTLARQNGVQITAQTGDTLGTVTGVVSYNFGNFEVLPTTVNVSAGNLQREITSINFDQDRLTVATYNVENLGGNAAQARFDGLASQVVTNLKRPDVIALQEIGDSNGTTNDGTVSAAVTAQRLIDAIVAAGGPRYTYVDVPPANNRSGGQAGTNIRVGYLVNEGRVEITGVERTPGAFNPLNGEGTGPLDANGRAAFDNLRVPLELRIRFNGNDIVLINNHLTSKGGSAALFGQQQAYSDDSDFFNNGVTRRNAQAAFLNNRVDSLLAANPNANVLVLGDLNDFQFSTPLQILQGLAAGDTQVLWNLAQALLPASDLYSLMFEGNAQLLDHILASSSLLAALPLIDIVRLNSEFLDLAGLFSDHDPTLASFLFRPVPEPASLSLFLLGLAGAGAMARRRRKPALAA